MIDKLTEIAISYIQGDGLEIGAFSNPIQVKANVTYIDRLPEDKVKALCPHRVNDYFKTPDIICNGETLELIPDNSQDFIIGSHIMEHFKNPLLALFNWDRVLKNGGILYIVIPDMRYTADSDREVTTLDHLIEDFKAGVTMTDDQPDCHEHYWEQKEIIELIHYFTLINGYNVELLFKRDFPEWSDTVAVLRKLP